MPDQTEIAPAAPDLPDGAPPDGEAAQERPALPEAVVADTAAPAAANLATSEIELRAGPFQIRAQARITPGGLLAVGVLVSGILLSTAVLVSAAAGGRRRGRREAGPPRRSRR